MKNILLFLITVITTLFVSSCDNKIATISKMPEESFITTWETTTDKESITIPTIGSGYNYIVDWGDGSNNTGQTGNATHTYKTAGRYTVKIYGDFPHIHFINAGTNPKKIKTIEQWGNIVWKSMENAFLGCSNLTYNAKDVPNLSNVTNMSQMFAMASVFNGDISNWDTSNITDMSQMFYYAKSFNGDISNWDTSHVTDMSFMFGFAMLFNGDISEWNTSNVINMRSMFQYAIAFNSDISKWNISNVTNMQSMFESAHHFNRDISNWNTSQVTNMSHMFLDATAFSNHDLSGWNVENVAFHTSFMEDAGPGNTEPIWP